MVADEQFRMNNREHILVRRSELFLENVITRQRLLGTEKHDVLAIPVFNLLVAPYSLPQCIYRHKTSRSKQLYPILGPLLIDVIVTHLKRNCGRKEDNGR